MDYKHLMLPIMNQKKVITYFQDKCLLVKEFKCPIPICAKIMEMEYNKQYIDNYCYLCRSKSLYTT